MLNHGIIICIETMIYLFVEVLDNILSAVSSTVGGFFEIFINCVDLSWGKNFSLLNNHRKVFRQKVEYLLVNYRSLLYENKEFDKYFLGLSL